MRLLMLISAVARSLIRQQPLCAILEEVVRLTLEHTDAVRVFLVLKDEKTGDLAARSPDGPQLRHLAGR